jgi:hypothetical protein
MKTYILKNVQDFSDWSQIHTINDFNYPWQSEKAPETSFQAFYDSKDLYFRFVAFVLNPLIFVKDNHKDEVLKSERVEIFLRKDYRMTPYFCFEIDPLGRLFDYKASYYRQFEYTEHWIEPLFIHSVIENDKYCIQGKFNLKALRKLGLLINNEIQIGLFRAHCTKIENNKATFKWISWVKPDIEKPDFHVPTAFGTFLLK